ncbi:MAG: hypothetical protein NZ603_01610 [Acidimicrobiales bacterium]|nr:hypothetical protein [Acidimicrobiales bacterium]
MHGSVMRLLVVVCLAGACGGTELVAPPTTAPPTATAPSSVVPEVLDFTATLSDGTTFVGADLAGRDVLFWFWAPS